jgi:ATP-dependent Lon protease
MTVVKKEIKRLKKMPQQSPEYPMLRNYLELVSELPWNKSSMEVIDIQKAKEV